MSSPRVLSVSAPHIETIISPFVRFAKREAAGGIVLLLSTAVALVWANSRWESSYHAIWNTQALCCAFGQCFLTLSTRLVVRGAEVIRHIEKSDRLDPTISILDR